MNLRLHSIRLLPAVSCAILLAGCPPQEQPKLPLAFFGAIPIAGPAPLTVRFNDTSDLQGAALVSRLWDFGDGASSTLQQPTHVYAEPGDYTVALTVTSTAGTSTATREAYISVREDVPEEGEGEGDGAPEGEGGSEGLWDGEGGMEGEGQGGPLPEPGEVGQFLGQEFVWIPPGTFIMGTDRTPEELEDIYGDRAFYFRSEQPAHEVTITRGFWMGRHEVTQEFWEAHRGDNPSLASGAQRPVERVSWYQAQELVEQLSSLGAGTFRLPTEAEWEYACRAGTSTEFSFGDDPAQLRHFGWFFDNTAFTTREVGLLQPNPWGLFDIHGNVFEWCSDWYSQTYYSASPATNPRGPEQGEFKVRRGGSFSRTDAFCRSGFRLWNAPDAQLEFIGLRLVRER